jgi:1-deoxyxylulose-5-phosphate synthase
MRYRRLGTTGLQVSELCLGTANFIDRVSRDESRRILGSALDGGVNFFDTADAAAGAEELLGECLQAQRGSVVIATKVFRPTGPGPNGAGLSRKHIVQACEASLRRLRTDHIDLYFAHADDTYTPLEETLGAFDLLVRAGKVLYVGASNYSAWRLNEALWTSRVHGLAEYCCLQVMYNLRERSVEAELLPMCEQKGVGVIAWSPLAHGELVAERGPRDDGDAALVARNTRVAQALRDAARREGCTPAQAALAWLLTRPAIASLAVGASSASQLEENLGATGVALSPASAAELEAAAACAVPYPVNLSAHVRALRAPQPPVARS